MSSLSSSIERLKNAGVIGHSPKLLQPGNLVFADDNTFSQKLSNLCAGFNALVVADSNTARAQNLPECLNNRLIFQQPPKPDANSIHTVISACKDHDANMLIAVGSGTISDLCKYASYQLGIEYICVPTAASMNGYASPTASIINSDGLKTSINCNLPIAIIGCIETIRNAPARLTASGIGDSLCTVTVEADLRLASFLGHSEYKTALFEEITLLESRLLQNPDDTECLMELLVLTGFGMYAYNSSAPASQSEHAIVHSLEKLQPELSSSFYHGELVAFTTRIMIELQTQLVKITNAPSISVPLETDNYNFQKFDKAHVYNQKLADTWQDLRERLIDEARASSVLKAYNLYHLPAKCDDLTISNDVLKQAIKMAPLTRDRLGFLDLNRT